MTETVREKDGVTYIKLPMICVCGEERRHVGDDLLDKVNALLEVGDPRRLVSNMVSRISWDHEASIEDLWQDMWFGLKATSFDGKVVVKIECDLVEHGLAAVLLWLEEVKAFKPLLTEEEEAS